MGNMTSIEQEIIDGVIMAVGDPFMIGALLIMFFTLAAAIMGLRGELMFIMIVPSLLWVFGLGLGLSTFEIVMYLAGGFIVGMALLQIIKR